MPIEILMPVLSPTMREGNIVKWHKQEGDLVNIGDTIVEIETDKATMEVEAVDAGILAKIVVPSGSQNILVNTVVAVLLEDGENKKNLAQYDNLQAPVPPPTKAENLETSPHKKEQCSTQRVFISPLAKRLAQEQNININELSGTNGRIVKKNVLEHLRDRPKQGVTRSVFQFVPHSNMRKAIAKKLCETKQDMPHFYLTLDCNTGNLLKLRTEINQDSNQQYKISVNDFIVKASSLALKLVPDANVSWEEDGTRVYEDIDVSVAVAIKGGIITPIVQNTDQKSLLTISQEIKTLTARAKGNKLAPEEFQGGTFCVSNLGMYGIKQFSAIINSPQSCILAVRASEKRAIVQNDDKVIVAPIMTVTLSCDHRVIDGAVGARLLAEFKNFIEHPIKMLI